MPRGVRRNKTVTADPISETQTTRGKTYPQTEARDLMKRMTENPQNIADLFKTIRTEENRQQLIDWCLNQRSSIDALLGVLKEEVNTRGMSARA